MSEAEQILSAGQAAVAAALRAEPALNVGQVISGIVTLAQVADRRPEAADWLATHIAVEVTRLVGKRRAHELVDLVANAGAGSRFA